jgi:hypothetical protein
MREPPKESDWRRFLKYSGFKDWMSCWEWKNPLDRDGYGHFHYQGKSPPAHRQIMHWICGKLPRNLVVDHVVCNNPPCVNPLHLVPTTNWENIKRTNNVCAVLANRTHCSRGHELSEDNWHPYYLKRFGARACLACIRDRDRDYQKVRRTQKKHVPNN